MVQPVSQKITKNWLDWLLEECRSYKAGALCNRGHFTKV